MMMLGVLVTARASEFWMSCRPKTPRLISDSGKDHDLYLKLTIT